MNSPLAITLQVALSATLLGGVTVLAVVMSTHGRRLGSVLDAVLTVPLVLPPTVLGYYLLVTFGARGPLGHAWEAVFGNPLAFTRAAAIFAATITSLPLVLQGTRAAFDAVDPTMLEAARMLGATRWSALARVGLPLAARGVASALLLGFARACGDFGLTLMLAGNIPGETRTASLALYDAVLAGHDDEARQLALTLLALALVIFAVVQTLGRKARNA